MTYCFAWRKGDKVFLIADSVTSTLSNEDFIEESTSFGEVQGLYNKYWTQETSQKIIKINSTTAVAYSCDNEEVALEAIEYLNYASSLGLEQILQNICNSYNGGFELIVISKIDGANKIYHLKGTNFVEIEDFIDMGSGRDIPNLSSTIKEIISSNLEETNYDDTVYLANIISTVQCVSLNKEFIKYGVGGAFFGMYLDAEIDWAKDFMYHFTDNGDNKRVVSLICRDDTIFYASSFNENIRYFFDKFTKKKVQENKYYLESIVKVINTATPDYIVYYDFYSNSLVFTVISGYSSTTMVKLWIKRQSNEVKYAILTGGIIGEFLKDKSSKHKFLPTRYMLNSRPTKFIPRENFIINEGLEQTVQDLDLVYDLDLKEVIYKKESCIKSILDRTVSNYRNIIIIDANYLDELITEKITYYRQANDDMGLNLDLELKLEPLIERFTKQIASSDFERYSIHLLINKRLSPYLNEIIYKKWKKLYENVFVTEDFQEDYLAANIFHLLKDYYVNETYFHIDKIILFCDNANVNEILQLLPYSNFELEEFDVLLIREANHSTRMDGRFRYIVSDMLIGEMFGLSHNDIAYAEYLIEQDLLYK